MATNYTSIQITDGTTTADLTDGTNYSITEGGWSPKVARLREAGVGGQSTHEDVVEEIRFSVFATSITTALSKFATIQGLLDQARQFALGEAVTPVELQVEPQGTTSNEWRALILGGELILPDTWADNLVNKAIEDCVVRIVRRGVWLKTSYTPTASTTVKAGVVTSMSSTAVNAYSPMSVRLYSYPQDVSLAWMPGVLVVTNSTSKVQIYDSASGTGTGGATISSGDGTSGLGGSAYDLNGAADEIEWTVSGFSSTAKRAAIYVSAKLFDGSGTTVGAVPFTLRLSSPLGETTDYEITGVSDQVVFCGVFEWSSLVSQVTVIYRTARILVDYMAVVQIDDPNTHVLDWGTPLENNLSPLASSNGPFAYSSASGEWGVKNEPLSSVSPYSYFQYSGGRVFLPCIGDTYLTTNGTIRFAWLALGHGGAMRPEGGDNNLAVEFTYTQASIALT